MKRCFKCRCQKELNAFYKHPQMADGHLNKCKECTKSDEHTNRALSVERLRVYEAKRSKTAKRKILQAKIQIRDRKLNPKKAWARQRLDLAIRKGQIVVGPCERVNEGNCYGRIEGHHDDYDSERESPWL